MVHKGKLHPFAAFVIFGGVSLVVLAFMAVSGFANVNVWWNSATGWAQYIFATVGVGAELVGAVGLIVLVYNFAHGHWLKGLVALALWVPAVGFNGYSSYRYFTSEGAIVMGEGVTEKTALILAETRVSEITSELAAIGEVRASSAIRAERDALPENYKSKRAALSAELGQAERKEALEAELATHRQTVLDKAAVSVQPDTKALTAPEIVFALVLWMEAMKALGLWVISGRMDARTEAKAEKKADLAHVPEKRAPEPPMGDNVHVLMKEDGRQVRVL